MQAFTTLTAIAAPLLRSNIDTDVIIRIEKVVLPRPDQGRWAFAAWRYLPDGTENPAFVLNESAYRDAQILLAGANFGCGSSREAAVWAMQAMGLRCVIAPSYGDIFFNNCFQNGMLPVVLPEDAIRLIAEGLATDPARHPVNIDLVQQCVTTFDGERHPFQIDALRRDGLLSGLDAISMTRQREPEITAYQAIDRERRPWVYESVPAVRPASPRFPSSSQS